MMRKLSPHAEWLVALILFGVALTLCLIFFERLPIENTSLAIDWQGLWAGVQGGTVHYSSAIHNPPWSLWFILPLGWLSFRASWGVLSLITMIVLILCVPQGAPSRRRGLALAFLLLSFPSLRHLADGNLEALVIGGILLTVYGYNRHHGLALALGILLATTKPQEVWLLMLAVGWGLLQHWSVSQWMKVLGLVGLIVLLSLIWTGAAWWSSLTGIPYKNTIIDVSLSAAIQRLGWPGGLMVLGVGLVGGLTLWVSLKHTQSLSRSKAALLACASMLLSPYAAGNSFLTILAIGLIPLFLSQPWLGGGLILLTNLPYLANHDLLFYGQAYYWTSLLLIAWGVFAWQVGRESNAPAPAQLV